MAKFPATYPAGPNSSTASDKREHLMAERPATPMMMAMAIAWAMGLYRAYGPVVTGVATIVASKTASEMIPHLYA